ncbi:O-antigen ligase family protein [Streptomyces sp. NPDC052107]|uniref:O-antigen ligase family protein n=1 Tax=Streptomyces sp. NPDC052107 TaxID=3155632 RepID=UPI0034478ECD
MLGKVASPFEQHKRPRLSLIAIATSWLLVGGNLLSSLGLAAPATVLIFLAASLTLPCALVFGPGRSHCNLEPLNPRRARIPSPLWAFALWVSVSAICQQTEAAAQNALVYLSFVALLALTAAWTSESSPRLLLRWMRVAAVVGAVGYLATVVARGPGSSAFYVSRTYGEIVWIGMAVAVALATRSRVGYVAPLLLLAASLLSLSRTASVACALQFIACVAKGRGRGELLKVISFGAVTGYAVFLVFTQFQPLRNRFIDNDHAQIGGIVTGTSGRSRLWAIMWDSIREAPWLGHGIGSAHQTIRDTLGPNRVLHPLNDYLRLWNDLGFVGLLLWVLAILILGHGAFRRWRTARNDADRAAHQAAFLSLIGLSINAFTSNPLVYIFVMAPVAVIIGTSMGRANAEDPHPADVLTSGKPAVPELKTAH